MICSRFATPQRAIPQTASRRALRAQVLRRDALPSADPPGTPWHRLPELVLPAGAAAVALHLLLADAPRLEVALPPSPPPSDTQLRQPPAPAGSPWARLGGQQAPALTEPAQAVASAAEQHVPPPLQAPLPAAAAADSSKPFALDGATAATLAVCMVVAALANAAGVGGGAFIVPLLYVGLGLGIKDCTALSQAAIAGGALGAVACTGRQRHPLDAARPLVDWRLALVLTPTLLLGCTTGVLFNQLLPAWGVTLLLIPLLTVLTARTAAAAARLHCAESTAAAAAAEAAAASAASLDLQEADLAPPPAAPPCADCAFPYQHAAELLALWAVLLGFQCGKHQFSPGSLEFAAVYAAQAATALSASAFFVAQAAASRRQPDAGSDCSCSADADAGSPAGAGSPGVDPLLLEAAGSDSSAWSTRQLAGASAVALAGGTVAGMLGIGGGMVVGPVMLELGVHPQVSAATASAMVLFSASSAAASFALEGRLNAPYAAAFSAACAVAAYLGVSLVGAAVNRSGRASLVAVLLTAIIGTGCLLTAVYSGADALAELRASL